MQQELWLPVQDYEGIYSVSNLGNVRAEPRTIINKNGDLQRYPEKLLKQEVVVRDHTNYRRVTLSLNNNTTRWQVHRLVALHFLNNPDNLACVNHLDNNGENNIHSNLQWSTHSGNMLHAQQQGRLFASQSLGGKIGSKVGIYRMLKKAKSLYDTTINNWKVLPNSHVNKITEGGNSYNYVKCICSCGHTQDMELGRVHRKEITMCNKCATANKNKNKLKI